MAKLILDEPQTKPRLVLDEQPDFGRIALPREKLPGVWDYNKQLEALLGDPDVNIEDFIPKDVRFDLGRIIGMTEKPDETKEKMKNSLYYSIIFNTSPKLTFNVLDELNEIAFNKPINVEKAMKEYRDYYTGAKSYVGAINHGLRRANVMAQKQIGGLAKMVGEFITPQERVRPLFPALHEWEKANADTLIKWGDMILADVEDYYRENKAEAIQILPDIGYLETLKQYITKPVNLVQGIVESVPLMLEGILGVTIGGPAAGIALMSVPISGEVYANARAEGTEPLPAMDQAIITSTGEATIEQWTLSRKLGLMRNFRKIVADGLPKVLWEGTKAFFRGTAEEGSQEFNRNFWQWLFTDRSQQWTENVAESMAAGGPIEMVMAGAFSAAGAVGPTIAKEQQVMRLDKIQEAVRAEPTLTEEHKAEIIKELDTVREQVEQDQFPETIEKPVEAKAPVSAEKRTQAIEFVKGVLSQEQFAALDEKARIEIGQRMLAEQGVEVTAEELAEIPPTVPIPAPQPSIQPQKPAEAVEIPPKAAEVEPSPNLLAARQLDVNNMTDQELLDSVVGEKTNEILAELVFEQTGETKIDAIGRKILEQVGVDANVQFVKPGISKGVSNTKPLARGEVRIKVDKQGNPTGDYIVTIDESLPRARKISTLRHELQHIIDFEKEGFKPSEAIEPPTISVVQKGETLIDALRRQNKGHFKNFDLFEFDFILEQLKSLTKGQKGSIIPVDVSEKEKQAISGKSIPQAERGKGQARVEDIVEPVVPTEAKPEPAKPKKRIISKDSYETAKKRLTDRDVLRMGVDPQGFIDFATIGAYHIESGLRTFAEWSKKMIEEFGEKIRPHLKRVWNDANMMATVKEEPVKAKKPIETPIQKAIKIEKEIIPKQSKEKFTPPIVQKETKAEVPDSDSETQNAANLLEGYWREHDERKLEIDVAATKNQDAITKALDKKQYLPESDIETSKMSQAMMLYIDLKEHPSGHQFAEELSKQQREIYELSKNLPANIQRIADSIIKQNREFGALAIDKEIISIARENYIAHIWERPTRQESLQARFRQTTARAKARTLEGGIMEGWAKGKTLRVKDVTLATQIAQSQINQAIVGREMLKLGKKWGLLSHKQPADWVRVEHPGFTTWRWAGKAEKAKTYGRNFFVTEKGDLMERVPVYAEPELGKKLNKIFTPSALYKVPGIETISRYNAQIKTTILFTSLYHHQAFLRSYAFGSRGLNPKAAYEKGRQAIMNMTPEVRLLVRNGLTIGRIQDYDPRMIEGEQTIWGRALSHTKPTEAARAKLVDLRKRQERFLFNKLGPALKIQAGILELKAELKRNQAELESGEITADEIAAAVANLINNDFGGLHLGRMGRSQTAQHIFRLLALAPDWTESNIRSAVDAFRKGETGYLHRMFWGRIAIKGLGATILFNLLLSAFDDDDFAERYKKAWETGRLRWLDIDITPIFRAMGGDDDKRKYFSLLGHFRDPVKFTVHPIVSAKHKGSVVSRVMMDMMIGEDWAGRKFTTIGELTGITEDGKNSGRLVKYGRGGARPIEPSQIPSYALYEVRSAMPIPIQNIIAFLGGELDAFDAITKSAGLMTATTYPERKRKAKKITR